MTNIGDSAFAYCYGLTEITMGNGVTSIGNNAFDSCIGLTNVIIPNSVTNIGYRAFSQCTYLTSITLGKGIKNIGNFAFYECVHLTEINFNAINCNDLEGGYNSSTGSVMKNYTFYAAGRSKDGITVNIGSEVAKIPSYLFYTQGESSHSPKITNIVFSVNSVCETIGSYAFCDCKSLINITIPQSVKGIGICAFSGCNNLTDVTFESTTYWYVGDKTAWENKTGGTRIYCTNTANNATNLKSAKASSYWYKVKEIN